MVTRRPPQLITDRPSGILIVKFIRGTGGGGGLQGHRKDTDVGTKPNKTLGVWGGVNISVFVIIMPFTYVEHSFLASGRLKKTKIHCTLLENLYF